MSSKGKNAESVDSWEDEAENESEPKASEENPGTGTPIKHVTSSDYPSPPPPTPSSPSFSSSKTLRGVPYQTFPPYGFDGAAGEQDGQSSTQREGEDKRQEKTTAVASRLIAAGIGQKPPRRTKEEREYDQAMKVQEQKKREQAKAEEERTKQESEKAKKAVWED